MNLFKMTKTQTLLALVSGVALLGLGACAKDSEKSNSVALAPPAFATAPVCANPLGLDAVPTEWVAIKADDLINGRAGTYELTQSTIHVSIESETHELASALAEITVTKADGKMEMNSNVTCLNLVGLETLSLELSPTLSFSQQDGSFTEQGRIKFLLGTLGLTPTPINLEKHPGNFRKEASADEDDKALAQAFGIEYDSKLYQISNSEFEMRVSFKGMAKDLFLMPASEQPATVSASLRYRLAP